MSNVENLRLIRPFNDDSANDDSAPARLVPALPMRLMAPLPPALLALLDAVMHASKAGYGFDLVDVASVEAFWQMLDEVADAHGFVLSLRDGRRLYLQLVSARDDDEPVDELEMLPMDNERYPQIDGGGIAWSDDVQEINQLLHS